MEEDKAERLLKFGKIEFDLKLINETIDKLRERRDEK